MILSAYALLDEKAQAFSVPWFVASEGLALRALSDLVADNNTTVGRHPRDFVLYQVGTFDDHLGELAPMIPRQVIRADSLLQVQQQLPLAGEG